MMAIHESGHACHAAVAFSVEAVVEVRLTREGGHTETVFGLADDIERRRELSPSARTAVTRSELHDQLIGTLCGMTAEQVLLGEVTTGAGHDRAAATDTAGTIVGLDVLTNFAQIEVEATAHRPPVGGSVER